MDKLRLYFFVTVFTLAVIFISIGCVAKSAQRGGGIDLAGMDSSVKPGDDFFGYANGTWFRTATIPPDRSNYGLDSLLAEEANLRTRKILEEASVSKAPESSDERKIGDYYAAYMNEAAIETKGIQEIRIWLDRIAAITNRRALAEYIAQTIRADVDPMNYTNFHTSRLLGLWVAQDFNDPSRYTPYLLQGGLGMPDREYYLSESPRMADIRNKYKAHIAAVLKLAKIPDADDRALRILDLETKIAEVHWSRSDSEEVLKANNPWKRDEFATKAPGLDWLTFFKTAELDDQDVFMVWQPSAIAGEASLVGSEPLEIWKEYLVYQILDSWSALLPRKFVEENFAFYGRILRGTPQLRERWKRAVASANSALGEAIGRLYVQRYFAPDSKVKVEAMVANLIQAFGRRIDKLAWMSPQTKEKAREKLATLKIGVGYPDRWRDYSDLEISRDDALGNAFRAELFEYRRNLAKLRKAVDRSEWWISRLPSSRHPTSIRSPMWPRIMVPLVR
jgi:putative endopeptidase